MPVKKFSEFHQNVIEKDEHNTTKDKNKLLKKAKKKQLENKSNIIFLEPNRN